MAIRKIRSESGVRIDWRREDIEFLVANWWTMTNQELADALNLRLTSVRMKCYEMGLRRMEIYYWTKIQVKFLRLNYKMKGDVEIAEMMNELFPDKGRWTNKHIRKKRTFLKLYRTDAQLAKIQTRNHKQGRYAFMHWKRWIGRETPIGQIRIWVGQHGRKFKVIKTKNGFVRYMPWLYRQKFGRIPRGKIITTKDGNNLNIVPENLEAVTREEIGRRLVRLDRVITARMAAGKNNKTDRALRDELLMHPELIDLKRKQMELNRIIREKGEVNHVAQ